MGARRFRNGMTACAAVGAAVVLAACGADTQKAAETVTVTSAPTSSPSSAAVGTPGAVAGNPGAATPEVSPVDETTVTRTVAPTKPAAGGGSGGAPATAGNGKCVDPASATVRSAVAGLGKLRGEIPYVVTKASPESVGSCPDLLWALTTVQGATASSPYQVLFFDSRGLIRTAAPRPTVYTSVTGHTRNTVTVQYRWLAADEPSCCATGGPVQVTFSLSGDGLEQNREVPTETMMPA